MKASKKAANQLDASPSITTESADKARPKSFASFAEIFPDKQNKENEKLLENQNYSKEIARPAIQPKNAYNVGAPKK